MSREWKPGDVALVEAGCWANRKVALRLAEGWSHVNGVNLDEDGVVIAVRPLVVIDPDKNPEGLEYLHPAHFRAYAVHLRDARRPVAAQMMEFLARQFEAFVPPPPKPDEPQDRYAVVLDADGVEWLRSRDGVWAHSHTEGMRTQWTTRSWSSIAAVHVLMAHGKPPAIRVCTRLDHPAKRHGHYSFGGRHWCSDFRSTLLSEENMGHIERGWIVIFEKPQATPNLAQCGYAGNGVRR